MKWLVYGLIIALDLLIWFPAKSQEHEHGVGDIPDWYDPECCNRQDCRPVEDASIDFSDDYFSNPMLIYTKDEKKLEFPKSRWRRSKDERHHVCFRGDTVYCAYVPVQG